VALERKSEPRTFLIIAIATAIGKVRRTEEETAQPFFLRPLLSPSGKTHPAFVFQEFALLLSALPWQETTCRVVSAPAGKSLDLQIA
jgi:hypothetical protein